MGLVARLTRRFVTRVCAPWCDVTRKERSRGVIESA
jgi:hypothetical protein